MKKILMLLFSTMLFITMLFIKCRQIKEGSWIVKDKIYQYDRNLMVSDYDMLRDFDSRYGQEYEVVAFSSQTDTIVCRKK